MKSLLPVLAACAGVWCAVPAWAQTYPVKPIRLVAAFSAGGTSDVLSRAISGRMAEIMGQPVVVEIRAGAGGNIGAEFVARAAPDGYTLLLGGGYITTNPSLHRKLGYDPIKDFAPVSQVVSNQYMLVVHPSVPASDAKALIALAKARPGQLNYASAGVGSPAHLAAELFRIMADIKAVHIAYKGATPALIDLIGGQVDYYFGAIPGSLPHVKSGRLRAMAVTGNRRSGELPQVPTMAEAALPAYELMTWFGVVAPAGTPRDIINRLNSVIVQIVKEPATNRHLAAQGVDPVTNTPEEFAVFIRNEVAKFAKLVKLAGIQPE